MTTGVCLCVSVCVCVRECTLWLPLAPWRVGHKEASPGQEEGLLLRRPQAEPDPRFPGPPLLSPLRLRGLDAVRSASPRQAGERRVSRAEELSGLQYQPPLVLIDTTCAIGVFSSDKPPCPARARTQAGRIVAAAGVLAQGTMPTTPATHALQATPGPASPATPEADAGQDLCRMVGATMLSHLKLLESPQGPLFLTEPELLEATGDRIALC